MTKKEKEQDECEEQKCGQWECAKEAGKNRVKRARGW